ncbi:hypothetical protein P8A22_06365 [Streptomyces laculatispora]|uniref:Uncharacterized protein n=1 Tax=Streptomyces laculatispora TaxID=887464 RepID=A0ABY9I0D9_9ACTN|nr:hypothetical protein [Streptomyces laculatispora]WLQ39658.1 hypothetical protein P8A22_06365 [Streptomyces laculatispora]
MLRSIAITLATVAAAGFIAAAPAAANDGVESGKILAGYQAIEASRSNAEFFNLGGPYGITYAKENKEHLKAERGFFYAEYLRGH